MHVMAVLVEHLHERDPAAEADHHPTGEGLAVGSEETAEHGTGGNPEPRALAAEGSSAAATRLTAR